MKSIRQKAKAYDEALERAKAMIKVAANQDEAISFANTIFPELAGSEDEKIRKELIDAVQGLWDNDALPMPLSRKRKDAWIAWLEKQGEQKSATIDIDKMVNYYANNKERGNEEFGKPVNCMIRAYRQGLNDAIGKVVFKSWSEEDEKILNTTISFLSEYAAKGYENAVMCIEFLKSLKQRIGG